MEKTLEIDQIKHKSSYDPFSITLNNQFINEVSNFKTLNRYRSRRTRVAKLNSSKVIMKNNLN